jgi:hypothetical protein
MLALSDAFEALARRYPADDEAQIFNALYLAATQQRTEQSFARSQPRRSSRSSFASIQIILASRTI